ncbi:hypothetical protein SNEBB_005332 [Seison nebaliae]|nr:hypothetical protein SNEBB_005332 [Seison nebaliae]
MKLDKISENDRRKLCQKYFYIGCAALPLVWLINCFWFGSYAFGKSRRDPQIRRYVISSAIGFIISMIALTTWIIVFQKKRVDWGEFGDKLTLIPPRGRL